MPFTHDQPSQLDSALPARVEIAQAALDAFQGQPFAWGTNDCAKLAAFVLRRAGYKPSLAQFGDYRSDRAAARALRARKMKTVLDWIDSIKGLRRISPASTLPGDLIAFPGEGGWHGLTVAIGNGRVLGFSETVLDGGCAVIAANLGAAVAAWEVHPWRKS
jgi:hypothetical protein